MTKRQPASAPPDQKTQDSLLSESVDQLTAELRVIRDVLDDLRIELQYLVRNPAENRDSETIERLRITTLPLDPAADDLISASMPSRRLPEPTIAELRAAAETAHEKQPASTTNQPTNTASSDNPNSLHLFVRSSRHRPRNGGCLGYRNLRRS